LSELAGELKVVKKMSLPDCFAASAGEAGKGGNIYGRSRVQDGGARNQSRLVVGASCGLNKYVIRGYDSSDFGARPFPMSSAVDVFLNRGNIDETANSRNVKKT
jgi:hypothetical protein